MAMSPRERWLALLDGQEPDRIPTDYRATDEVTRRLLKDLGCGDLDEMYRKLHIDGVTSIGPRRTVRHYEGDDQANIWGVRSKRMQYEGGSYDETGSNPLAGAITVEEIHAHKWPSADDFDWDVFERSLPGVSRERIVCCGHYEPFLTYCQMRGMEQAMMDLLIAPQLAEAALTHLFDYHYAVNERAFDLAGSLVDLTIIAEDLGSQTSLLMGLEQIRRFILPNQRKMGDLARSHGIRIRYHTDGAARDVLPDLIDVTGIEILDPIQWRCPGMEREGLVRDFAGRIIFHGAMDNQQTLAFGSVEDVRNEVHDNIRIFAGARWICAPCHNIQPVSPTANIVAMYETIHEFGEL